MAETLKAKNNQRVIFPLGKQRECLDLFCLTNNITKQVAADSFGVSLRTFSDWRRENSHYHLACIVN